MTAFFEIAYAAASQRLCLFTGTGFSKAVSNNEAPSWQTLLESICELLPHSEALKTALFPAAAANPLGLEEAAQVISIELSKIDKDIHHEIATKIALLAPRGDNSNITAFLTNRSFSAVTTNYDKLLEQLAGYHDCQSMAPGLPIPRFPSRVTTYHVHGSIDSPVHMVVTSDDYFKFINAETYFSRKLSTVLYENTVVILGYSLGDANLKAIINDYRGFSRHHIIGSSIFFVSRSGVDQQVKDFYSHCFGIRVLDQLEIHDFFRTLNHAMPMADKRLAETITNIRKVALDGNVFTKGYLKTEDSFFEIICSLSAIGLSINDTRVVRVLGQVIQTKTELTNEYNAWTQYEHLAKWLIYLATILELNGTSIEQIFLSAALHSMNKMRKELYIGYSWHAYRSWKSGWSGIIASNRALIRRHVETNTTWTDALDVVTST